jgi:hypothetical protein
MDFHGRPDDPLGKLITPFSATFLHLCALCVPSVH